MRELLAFSTQKIIALLIHSPIESGHVEDVGSLDLGDKEKQAKTELRPKSTT